MKTLLFFGELPPKVNHGVSISNKRVLEDLSDRFEIISIEDDSSFKSGVTKIINIFRSLLRLLKNNCKNIDIFYLNCPVSLLGLIKNMLIILIVKFKWKNVSVVSHLHRGDVGVFLDSYTSKKIFDIYYNVLDQMLVLSHSVIKELVSRGYNKEKLSILYNSVDESFLAYANANLDDDPFNSYYLSLSNYIPTKNLVTTLEFFKLNSESSIQCYGSSDGDYCNVLKDKYSSRNIFINGPVYDSDKNNKIRSAKAMLISSKNEGMPLVILEALALGTPVICYDVGCIKEYLGHDYPGLVTELTDEAFFRKISWLNSLSFTDYLSLKTHSTQVFWDNFSPKAIRAETIKIFSK
ncbi:glycosyltransferase family 4 protein [Vibrio parahaemolyticus]|uniref:N-acetyl-alpha-D-glucosaminyl L-malate synthase n=2 Tax=Vibrio parahaemolyticus TaxID=670 RepID=A0A7M1W713_VIBPH|nr:glycosyltransferase [Vibrio parahaemolyticus]EHK4783376.1 glycosyltransferase [Vibrio parahaemolyticus]EJG2226703.1 glycosyltransferase [Vibrio parahaemolyticus]EKA7390669.1 glycosyltransferase [Vibrio parahaemolyticus]ELB2061111.1 glycosyltransferase [Vibrio parahaemolyticus]ELJ9743558.1 glycosyltransferase [Vibrio parahaemolyticus]